MLPCDFLVRGVTAFLRLGSQDSTEALHLGAIVNSNIRNKKHINEDNLAAASPPQMAYCLQYES